MAALKPLKLKMTVDTSEAHAALDEFADAAKLADEYDSAGRRLTAVDALVAETIAGDPGQALRVSSADALSSVAWKAIARDLARQVINAETEIAELDEKVEEQYEEGIDAITGSRDLLANQVVDLTHQLERTTADREFWINCYTTLDARCQEEQQAHCDTYIEAVRLSEELAGWQNSSHAEYRRSTAEARLAAYQTGT